ncbi:MAG: septal ring lytic transglycosylase RlpA family protein [Betaproteobacteria bacterium]
MSTSATSSRVLRGLAVAALTMLLAACGSMSKRPGGFYQDDGPPRELPRDLERIPDAVPRVEPFHRFANRPYTALGRSYAPITDDRPFRQRGLASWYGRQFHGNRTSSGEIYDMLAMTAAHPTLPIPSYVRVTHLRNGASVIVRVNDRGPFKPDRVIDLSYAAAARLGFVNAGTGEVEVVRLTHADIRAGRFGSAPPRDDGVPVAAAPVPVTAPVERPIATAPVAAAGAGGPWSVQLGAFQQAANAEALRERVAVLLEQAGFDAAERSVRVERDGPVHRVLVGRLPGREAAAALAARLERALARETSLHRAQ